MARLVTSLVAASLVAVLGAGCSLSTSSPTDADADAAAGSGAGRCCPPDNGEPSGSRDLGGWSASGSCGKSYDFWCTTNWRLENDDHGCPSWRYDMVPGCSPSNPMGSVTDSGVDATKPEGDGGIDAADGG